MRQTKEVSRRTTLHKLIHHQDRLQIKDTKKTRLEDLSLINVHFPTLHDRQAILYLQKDGIHFG